MKRWMMLAALAAMAMVQQAATAAVSVSVTNVTARQRYPWNGKVDIDCEVLCNDPQTNISLYATARDAQSGKSLPMRTLALEGGAFTDSIEVKAGAHRLVWDADADAAGVASSNVIVEIQALVGAGLYLVVDLGGGTNAASYPVSYLGAPPQGGWTDEYKTTKLVMRRIEAGTFMMGSPSDEVGRDPDETLHQVTISKPYYIGVFELTQKQWQLVMGTTPSSYPGDARPVESVSYNDIRGSSKGTSWPSNNLVDTTSFMGMLRLKTDQTFDLPTEAQWEYACRAGTSTAFNNGKNLTSTNNCTNMVEIGRYFYNRIDGKGGYAQHTKVGSYLPNKWGLYDMHGNVREWCLDWYGTLYSTAVSDFFGSSTGTIRQIRNGGWSEAAQYCRAANRHGFVASSSLANCGFRLAFALGQ